MEKNRLFCFIFLSIFLIFTSLDNSCVGQGMFSLDKKEKTSRKKSKSKLARLENYEQNYKKALELYKKGAWLSAAKIFEEIYPLAIGTQRADTILFLFANSYYNNRDYSLASFHFKDYARRYSGTEKAMEAAFLSAKSIYYLSPPYYLDQTETYMAQDELKMFIHSYPESSYMEECNVMMDNIRAKLSQKEFENAKLYYNRNLYKATQIALRNFLREYSESAYAPEALVMLVKNNYNYAKKSVEQKQLERYHASMDAYNQLQSRFPESKYLTEAVKYANLAQKQIDKLTSNN